MIFLNYPVFLSSYWSLVYLILVCVFSRGFTCFSLFLVWLGFFFYLSSITVFSFILSIPHNFARFLFFNSLKIYFSLCHYTCFLSVSLIHPFTFVYHSFYQYISFFFHFVFCLYRYIFITISSTNIRNTAPKKLKIETQIINIFNFCLVLIWSLPTEIFINTL